MSILLFLGPPGSGKSTQASLISEYLHIPFISMGKLVRLSLDGKYKAYKKSVNEGNLLPDHIVFDILSDTINQFDTNIGFVLEGYPRTIAQAERLDELLGKKDMCISMVLLLMLHDHDVILNRLTKRVQCSHCGKIVDARIEKNHSTCPVCHTPLMTRVDDNPDAISQRILLYQQEIQSLVDFYREKSIVQEINADRSVEEVKDQILQLIHSRLNQEIHS